MLTGLDLSDFDERVYLAVLHAPGSAATAIAAAVHTTPHRVRRAAHRLHDIGLLVDGAGPLVPADPRTAVAALTRRRLAELSALSTVADDLTSHYQAGRLRADPSALGAVVEGPAAITEWVQHLITGAEHEILLVDGPPHSAFQETTGDAEASLLSRGVTIRVVYAASAITVEGRLGKVREDLRLGEQARVLPSVPGKLLIVDRRRALLPLTIPDPTDGVLLVERSSLLELLIELFELLWRRGIDLVGADTEPDPHADAPSAADRELLALLVTGLTDESIARHLGISVRTLRRRLTDLLDRLGASSRFQAGVQAARRHWI